MRIGIWCDYNFTLAPSEGIGVFVDNLARGLLEADPNCELVLKCNHRDWQTVLPLVEDSHGRIAVDCGWIPSLAEQKLSRWTKKLNRFTIRPHVAANHRGIHLRSMLGSVSRFFAKRNIVKNRETIDSCNAWIIPYVGLDMEFSKPNIVVVHDLVCYHFPEMVRPVRLAEFMNTARRLVDQATLVACMSNFIRENDIKGVLGVREDRIRTVKPAVPKDILRIEKSGTPNKTSTLDPRLAGKKYLLYPSAFRVYKNHELLLKVVRALRDRGEADWNVVFTGIRRCPSRLTQLAKELQIESNLICLGKVSREDLFALYKHAFATVVPSRYEQGSFPVMEAIACGCPAIASDIPSLREQFKPLGSAMLYADPDSVSEVLSCIDTIKQDRQQVIHSQASGFEVIKGFTWKLAAEKWLSALREAMELSQRSLPLEGETEFEQKLAPKAA